MKARASRIFVAWLPLAVAIVGICALVYAVVQQDYRQSLNDPQIQMAEDAAQAVAHGEPLSSVVPAGNIDIGQSLAPYMIVYAENGKPVAYSGTLDGAAPVPPAGVFSYANEHGSDRLTWEPQPGVRTAIDIERVPGNVGYVLVGRNMREVETRESDLEAMVGIGMIVILAASLVVKIFADGILEGWS